MIVFRKNSSLLFLVKLSISIGLIAYLLWIVEWNRVFSIINQADKSLIVISPVFWLSGLVISSFRWQLVLADSKITFPFQQSYIGYLLGAFYNIFLPGVVGGDAVRIGLCVSQTHCSIGTATLSVLLERTAGVMALLSFLLGVTLLFPATVMPLVIIESTFSIAGMATVGISIIITIVLGRHIWARVLLRKDVMRTEGFIPSVIQAFNALTNQTLGLVFILSVFFQAINITGMFLLSRSIRVAVPFNVFFVVIPLVYLATLLPISLGGLGVREGTLAFLLVQFGVSTSDGVTLSFLIYLNYVFIGMLGGIVQLLELLGKNSRIRR